MSKACRAGVLWLAAWAGLTGTHALYAQDMDAAALFEQARPHVEAVFGQNVEKPLRLRAVSAAEMLQVPDPELAAGCVAVSICTRRFLRRRFGRAKERRSVHPLPTIRVPAILCSRNPADGGVNVALAFVWTHRLFRNCTRVVAGVISIRLIICPLWRERCRTLRNPGPDDAPGQASHATSGQAAGDRDCRSSCNAIDTRPMGTREYAEAFGTNAVPAWLDGPSVLEYSKIALCRL